MARGHAEALMPLIARVMDQAAHRVRRPRPHRRHHRPRQLHRTAGRHRGGARHRARGLEARDRALDARGLCGAHIAEDDSTQRRGGDRRAPRPRLSAGVRHQRPHAGRAAHRDHARCGARGLTGPRPHRRLGRRPGRGGLAHGRASRRCWSTQRGAPDIDWIARLGAAAADELRPAEAALPAGARRPAAGRRPPAAPMIGIVARLFAARRAGALAGELARRPRDGGAARRFVPSRMERRRVRAPAVRPQRRGAIARPSAAAWWASFCRGSPADEAEILSVAVASSRRGTGLGATAARSQSAPARGSRRAGGVPRGRRRQRAGAAGSTSAPASAKSAGARAITATRPASRRPRWCCAAICLSRSLRSASTGRSDYAQPRAVISGGATTETAS